VLIGLGKSRDALYENVLAENEREAVADLLQYLENVSLPVALCRCPQY
jgi:vacuolar protein 8